MVCNEISPMCYVTRYFKMMYASYIRSATSNGVILGGNLPYSFKVFRTHTKKLIIITKYEERKPTSCNN